MLSSFLIAISYIFCFVIVFLSGHPVTRLPGYLNEIKYLQYFTVSIENW